MTITYKTRTYTELADMAERNYKEYDGDDTIRQAELLQVWSHLLIKALKEEA